MLHSISRSIFTSVPFGSGRPHFHTWENWSFKRPINHWRSRSKRVQVWQRILLRDSISFLCCYNKAPQIGGLKTTAIYCLTVLGPQSLKSRCWQAHTASETYRAEAFLVTSSCWDLPTILAFFALYIHHSEFCPHCHTVTPWVPLSLCVSSSYKDPSRITWNF